MGSLSRRLPHHARGRNYLYNISLDPLERYTDSISAFTALNKESLYSADFRHQLPSESSGGVLAQMREYRSRVRNGDPLDALLYIDSKTYLPGDILTKVDRMSMAVSLEARVPLLDHQLIEFVTRIPSSLKMRGLETKFIFKRAVQGLVPDEILNRSKQGFGVPIQRWINQQLRDRIHQTLLEPRTRQRGYTETRYVKVLLDEHKRGRRDHSAQLWTLFMLELWFRTFIDRETRMATIAPPRETDPETMMA
jgi:asparagine synthase (glutamine-hydrolysing)